MYPEQPSSIINLHELFLKSIKRIKKLPAAVLGTILDKNAVQRLTLFA